MLEIDFTAKNRYTNAATRYRRPGIEVPTRPRIVPTIMHGVTATTAKRIEAVYESVVLQNEANSNPIAAYIRT
jgi:hypothetical protein